MDSEVWRDSLRPRIVRARRALSELGQVEVARRGGLVAGPEGLELAVAGRRCRLVWPGLEVIDGHTGDACPEELQALVLDYLERADGGPPAGRWVGFADLPHGAFYQRTFQGYSGDQLVRKLSGEGAAFRRAAERCGGRPLELGDAGYAWRALPLVPLAVVWWDGDDELPPAAQVLFDARAGHYLPTEGLAALGRMMCGRLIAAAREL